jgi:hypothetical protein
VNVPSLEFPAVSEAVQPTLVSPTGNVDPEPGLQETGTVPSTLSDAETLKVTTAPAAEVAWAVIGTAAGSVIVGGIVSGGGGGGGGASTMTVTVPGDSVHVPPPSSLALTLTSYVPGSVLADAENATARGVSHASNVSWPGDAVISLGASIVTTAGVPSAGLQSPPVSVMKNPTLTDGPPATRVISESLLLTMSAPAAVTSTSATAPTASAAKAERRLTARTPR